MVDTPEGDFQALCHTRTKGVQDWFVVIRLKHTQKVLNVTTGGGMVLVVVGRIKGS